MNNQITDIYKKRINKLREIISSKNLEAALIEQRENRFYLSGFSGTSAQLLITSNEAILFTDFRYIEQAEKQAPDYELVRLKGRFNVTLSEYLKNMELSKIGIEGGSTPFDKIVEYRQENDFVEFVSITNELLSLRIIKDESEISALTKSIEIADSAFEHILTIIKPGVTEMEIAAELEYHMKKNGATGPSFETIVASGDRAALPHGTASLKRVQLGDVITMDYGALCNGYCSDITRTVFLGKPDEQLERIYNIVLSAQLEAEKEAVKGKLGKEIDNVAREVISKAGYGDCFGHGLGHGVGIEVHEEPRLSTTGLREMDNGMVVTVEPGIYITGLGGVRIEDIIVINDDNPLILTKSSKDLIVL